MVIVKKVGAKKIKDSRGDDTIEVKIKTDKGKTFFASSPQGKSTGKHEVKLYKKTIEDDIKTIKKISDYFSEEIIENFDDLKRIEDIAKGNLGGNSILALEYAVLKALADKKKKQIWEIVYESNKNKTKKFPRLVGNCVGGGTHSEELNGKKPDFQEFLLIPNLKNVEKSHTEIKNAKEKIKYYLKEKDKNFEETKNDENAWKTSLNEKEVLEILRKTKISCGLDIAASGFYKRKKYIYNNPMLKRTPEEQLGYLNNIIKNFNIFYIEDPFDEEDFENFAKILEKNPKSLIVGDDLTVTNSKRLKKAIEKKSINALIVKPNQCGSLLEVKEVCDLAKKNEIKTVFSHRSGETEETALADLAFGFQADFFKCGTEGDARIKKIKRLIEIEESLKE